MYVYIKKDMRDYNFRIDKQEIIVKRHIFDIAYQREYYHNSNHRSMRRYNLNRFSERDPEDKWFNYLGEYTRVYKKSISHNERKWVKDWNYIWKEKYLARRSRLKEHIKNKIDEQIGQTYYIFNK